MISPPRQGPALLAAAALIGLAGCGGPSPADVSAVKTTVRSFLVAIADGDTARACALVTPAGQAGLAAAAGRRGSPCASVVASASSQLSPAVRHALRGVEVRRVTIQGDRATVRDEDIATSTGNLSPLLRAGSTTKLVKSRGRWQLAG